MKCEKCQQEVFLPFRCPYCGGYFCSEHRLPENHNCPQIELARTPKEETQPVIIQKQQPEYTFTYAPLGPKMGKIHFSHKEITHLAVAALLVMGVGLSFVGFSTIFSYGYVTDYATLALFIIIFVASFFLHEIAHKVAAQRRGLWAEFRLTLMGAILTMLSILPLFFKIISPGAVMVAGFADKESMGKISIAGPATNIALSIIFLAIALPIQSNSIFLLGAAFNAWIALFNLIPFGILDGFKVFLWKRKIWALAFATSLALTIIGYRPIF